MNSDLMARLIKRALASAQEFTMSAQTCAALGLADCDRGLATKQVAHNAPGAKHTFGVFLRDVPNHILVAVNRGGTAELYLTDALGTLRVAVVREGTELHTIPNDEAAQTFAAEMEHFADLASDLPPATATDVRDESKNA